VTRRYLVLRWLAAASSSGDAAGFARAMRQE
jgi:hypothetical protein